MRGQVYDLGVVSDLIKSTGSISGGSDLDDLIKSLGIILGILGVVLIVALIGYFPAFFTAIIDVLEIIINIVIFPFKIIVLIFKKIEKK